MDKNGWTALMEASDNGYEKIVKLLLATNADVNLVDKDGKTASQHALENKENPAAYTEIISLLEKASEEHSKKRNRLEESKAKEDVKREFNEDFESE